VVVIMEIFVHFGAMYHLHPELGWLKLSSWGWQPVPDFNLTNIKNSYM